MEEGLQDQGDNLYKMLQTGKMIDFGEKLDQR